MPAAQSSPAIGQWNGLMVQGGVHPDDFPVAERRAQHSVNAHDGLAVAFGPQEALYPAGGERLAGIAVGVKDASCRAR